MELHDGDIIVFKDILTPVPNFNYSCELNFNNTEFPLSDYIKLEFVYNVYSSPGYSTYMNFYVGSGYKTKAFTYIYNNVVKNSWDNINYKTITIRGDQTITDEAFINWLYENTVSGLPPRVMENMYAVVGDQIQYSFSNIGDVVGSIVNNGVLTIFTLGIFIVSLAVGLLRRISRRKNFK